MKYYNMIQTTTTTVRQIFVLRSGLPDFKSQVIFNLRLEASNVLSIVLFLPPGNNKSFIIWVIKKQVPTSLRTIKLKIQSQQLWESKISASEHCRPIWSPVISLGPRRHHAEQYEEPANTYAHQHHNPNHRNQSQLQEYDRGGNGRVQSHPPHSNPHLKRPGAISHYDGSPRAHKYAAVSLSAADQPSTIVRSNLRQIECVDDPISQQGTSLRWEE